MHTEEHWERVYSTKPAESVSWFQQHATTSLKLVVRSGIPRDGRIIDVGGGASTLVDGLLAGGYRNVSVLDLSASALQVARSRLGANAAGVHWMVGDITSLHLPAACFDLWHDRAVFHFLVDQEARSAYKDVLDRSLAAEGHLILATFAEDGPLQCSGLPVRRYAVAELAAEMGPGFSLLHAEREVHHTPAGGVQNFNYCLFRKAAGAA